MRDLQHHLRAQMEKIMAKEEPMIIHTRIVLGSNGGSGSTIDPRALSISVLQKYSQVPPGTQIDK